MLARTVVCGVLAMLAVLVALHPARAADTARVETTHFAITSEGSAAEAAEWGLVLEAAWPQMEAFFGATPALAKGERLPLRFFETADGMRAAIRSAGGVDPGGAGGYYCPVAKTSYAWRQPSAWWTRALVIHECVHQFHMRGVASKARGMAAWWTEGVAEHLSHHTWDGEHLRLGVIPPISLEEYPTSALTNAAKAGFLPESIVTEVTLDRPNAMHLVRFLATSVRSGPVAKWASLAKDLNAAAKVSPRDVGRVFGKPEQFRDQYLAWLRTVQQPLVCEYVEWDARALDAVRGTGVVGSIARTRGDVKTIRADVSLAVPTTSWRAGLVLRFTGPRDYVIGYVNDGTSAFVDEMKAGAWTRHDAHAFAPAADGKLGVSATRANGVVTFQVNGKTIAEEPSASGALGLFVDHCSADFRRIVIE